MKKILSLLAAAMLTLTACSDDEPAETKTLTGSYNGTNTVAVGEIYSGTANITCRVVENENILSVSFPEYQLLGSVMGDLTLGALTIDGIAYDEAKGAYYRQYGLDGLKQFFKAEKDGVVTMNKEYEFSKTSEITVQETSDGITVTNKYQLGAMPFPIVATFKGKK